MKRKIKRRFFLGAGLSGLAGAALLGEAFTTKFQDGLGKTEGTKLSLLESVIDTIIPADDFPGALETQVTPRLESMLKKKPRELEICQRALSNIKAIALRQYNLPFGALTIDQRENLLASILNDDFRKQTYKDLVTLRALVMRLFYQSNAGQQSMGYLLPANYPAY